MNNSRPFIIYAKLILTALFWGGTFIAGRMLAGDIAPASVSFLRFAVAAILLLGLMLRTNRKLPSIQKRHIPAVIALGLIGISAYNICFFSGLKIITASRASLIIATCPIFITVASAAIFKDHLTPLRIVGILISVFGALVVISRGRLSEVISTGLGKGELMILGCVLCWTAYSLIGKPLMKHYSALTLVTYSSIAGAAGLIVPALAQGMLANITSYSSRNWLAIGYLAVCGTVIGFTWFYHAIEQIGPTRAGLFINFVPVGAIVLEILFFGQLPTTPLIVGAALVITGVYLTNRTPKPPTLIPPD